MLNQVPSIRFFMAAIAATREPAASKAKVAGKLTDKASKDVASFDVAAHVTIASPACNCKINYTKLCSIFDLQFMFLDVAKNCMFEFLGVSLDAKR